MAVRTYVARTTMVLLPKSQRQHCSLLSSTCTRKGGDALVTPISDHCYVIAISPLLRLSNGKGQPCMVIWKQQSSRYGTRPFSSKRINLLPAKSLKVLCEPKRSGNTTDPSLRTDMAQIGLSTAPPPNWNTSLLKQSKHVR